VPVAREAMAQQGLSERAERLRSAADATARLVQCTLASLGAAPPPRLTRVPALA
jgi:hypothetical protein